MILSRKLVSRVVLVGLFCSPSLSLAEEVKQSFLSNGVTRKVGGYRPMRAEMDKTADIVKVAPEGLVAPKYGQIEVNGKTWSFVLDEPEDKPAKLYIDTNSDGDLTNDPATKWEVQEQGGNKMFSGEGEIDLGNSELGKLGMYRFDPNDERRAQLKNTLMFYTDFGYEFSFELDGKEFSTFASGALTPESVLPIDRDGNGNVSRNFEMAKIGDAFNFTGTTYEFSIVDGKLMLEKSSKVLDQMPMPPDLAIGKKALTFQAKTMDGTDVDFPKSYSGKLVMLDFWATWCGPCIAEIPNMKKAYEDHHEDGFEILGISFDAENMEEKVNEFLKERELPWAQIYEGKLWDTTLGKMHDVSGIPFVLLVDGDSGEILGTARELRGEKLSDFIGEQLAKKKETAK